MQSRFSIRGPGQRVSPAGAAFANPQRSTGTTDAKIQPSTCLAQARSRKIDVEDRAAAVRILKRRLAAETRDDLLHDAQAETGPALCPCVRRIGLRELLQDARLEGRRNERSQHDLALLDFSQQGGVGHSQLAR